LASITGTNEYIMTRNRDAIQRHVSGEVRIEGHTDLAIDGLKFSGNAQRRKRRWLLFHGTFLLDFALEKIDEVLRFPSKVPDYRAGRPHHAFVTNLALPAAAVIDSLRETWQATTLSPLPPDDHIQTLLREKYANPDWHAKF
jgi:lipoate-protein ligase A